MTDERWACVTCCNIGQVQVAITIVLRHIVDKKRRQIFSEQLTENDSSIHVPQDDYSENVRVSYALWHYHMVKDKLKYKTKCGVKIKEDENFTDEATLTVHGKAKDVRNYVKEIQSLNQKVETSFKSSKVDLSQFGDVEAQQHIISKTVERRYDCCIIKPQNKLALHTLIAPKQHHKGAADYVNFLKSSLSDEILPPSKILQLSSNETVVMRFSNDKFVPLLIVNSTELQFVSQRSHCQIVIVQGDIIKQEVSAIVNAANDRLGHGGGVAKAIADAAGEKLMKECKKLMANRGGKCLEVASAVTTTGGDLCDHVIHVVGPIYDKYRFDNEKCLELLTKAFSNCFSAAISLKVHSIALPAVSSGESFSNK